MRLTDTQYFFLQQWVDGHFVNREEASDPATAPHLAGLSLVESFADGWWYAAGLPDGRTLVALMTDADVAKAHDYLDAVNFLQAWRETRLLSHHVQPPDASPPIHGFAAQSGFIEHAAGDRWIAVGDALMGFDPLTSAGICGALHDAIAAVPAITGQLDGDTAEARGYPGAAKACCVGFSRSTRATRATARASMA